MRIRILALAAAVALAAAGCGEPAPDATATREGETTRSAPGPEAAEAAGSTGAEAAGSAAAAEGAASDTVDRAALRERAEAAFGELPDEVPTGSNPLTPEKIDLGRILYYETRLSMNDEIACNTCHPLDRFGADGEPTSPGHEGVRGERNSPTVYNAALHIAQFWDGRAADVEEQAKGPILNPVEMGMPSDARVLEKLAAIEGYAPLFAAAYPDQDEPITYDNIAKAIGAFERRLLTPGPIDAFIAGDLDALDEAQLEGLETFLDTGCITCHSGPAIGGGTYQKIGLVHRFETEDVGRAEVTGDESDRYVFKVPGLRNVAETGPWFHNGSVGELEEAVRLMAWHQLGVELDPERVASLVRFLEALTGTPDAGYIARPERPGQDGGPTAGTIPPRGG